MNVPVSELEAEEARLDFATPLPQQDILWAALKRHVKKLVISTHHVVVHDLLWRRLVSERVWAISENTQYHMWFQREMKKSWLRARVTEVANWVWNEVEEVREKIVRKKWCGPEGPGSAGRAASCVVRAHSAKNLLDNDVVRRTDRGKKAGGAAAEALRKTIEGVLLSSDQMFLLSPEIGASLLQKLQSYPPVNNSWMGARGGILLDVREAEFYDRGPPAPEPPEYHVVFDRLLVVCERFQVQICTHLLRECESYLDELGTTAFMDGGSRFLLTTMLREKRDVDGILKMMREDFPEVFDKNENPYGPVVHWDGTLVAENVELMDA